MRYRATRPMRRRFLTAGIIAAFIAMICGGVLYFLTVRQGIGEMYEADIRELENRLAAYEDLAASIHEKGDDMRLKEFECITIASGIEPGDFVDVRLLSGSGSDLVVLAKKEVMELDRLKGTISLCVNEAEINLMDKAESVWGQDRGSRIYLVSYIEPLFQDASAITFKDYFCDEYINGGDL